MLELALPLAGHAVSETGNVFISVGDGIYEMRARVISSSFHCYEEGRRTEGGKGRKEDRREEAREGGGRRKFD